MICSTVRDRAIFRHSGTKKSRDIHSFSSPGVAVTSRNGGGLVLAILILPSVKKESIEQVGEIGLEEVKLALIMI